MGNILTYAEHLSQQVPLPLTYDMDVDLIEMMKAIHLRIDMEGMNLPEQMLSFMKNWNILFGETCFSSMDSGFLTERDKRVVL